MSWFHFINHAVPACFRGRIPDDSLEALFRTEPATPPKNAMQAAWMNRGLPMFAAASAFIIWGLANFNIPVMVPAGRGRFRGAIRLLMWCRDNPNTVTAAAAVIGVYTLTLYVHRIRKATELSTNLPLTSADQNEPGSGQLVG